MGVISDKTFSLARCSKLALLAVFLFSSSSNAETQSRSYFGRTTDSTPVDIALQDKNEIVHFRIPKVFMTFSKNWEGGIQSGITLEVIYPSMTAVSATRNSMTGPDVVIISLDSFASTGGNYDTSKLLSILISTQWSFIENIIGSNNQSYRLYINKGDVEKRKDESATTEEFFVPDGGGIYLKCLRQLFNPLAGCRGIVNYGKNLSLNFQFKRSQFEKWPEIHKASVKLLDSFRQRANVP